MSSSKSPIHSREACAAVMSVVEAMRDGITVFDATGRVAYRNGALLAILATERARHSVQKAIDEMHRALVPSSNGGESNAPRPRTARMVVRTAGTEYRLRGYLIAAAGAEKAIVVSLRARETARRVTPAQLRDRYGLTPTEVRVAAMLEGGLRAREIASALQISVHTARRHSEAVLRKLRLSSRSLVRSKLSRE